MFYCAEALLRARGHSFSSPRAVISAFAQQLVEPGLLPKDLHRWLQTAFEERQVSDYEFVSTAEEPEVLEMAFQGRQFLSMTEELLKREGSLYY